jgi:hypothetical protein
MSLERANFCNTLRLARLLTLGAPSGATTDQDHGDDDGCDHAWSTADQEDAEQAWSAPVVTVGGRVGHIDNERFGNRADNEVQAEHETHDAHLLA